MSDVVTNWSPDRVRAFLQGKAQGEITLLDVRQPDEFEEEHIPGAALIPVGELPDRIGELDPEKPTVTYCRRGGRGSAGASILTSAGFARVINLDGGITAWNGQKVTGPPDAGAFWFSDAETIDDYVALAWRFEEGARIFYERAAELTGDDEARRLFRGLAAAEDHHKAALLDIHRKLKGDPEAALATDERPTVMEGGAPLEEALAWLEGKPADQVLEYAMALESTAYDRYVQLCRRQDDHALKAVFRLLADAEKAHTDQLAQLFGKLR